MTENVVLSQGCSSQMKACVMFFVAFLVVTGNAAAADTFTMIGGSFTAITGQAKCQNDFSGDLATFSSSTDYASGMKALTKDGTYLLSAAYTASTRAYTWGIGPYQGQVVATCSAINTANYTASYTSNLLPLYLPLFVCSGSTSNLVITRSTTSGIFPVTSWAMQAASTTSGVTGILCRHYSQTPTTPTTTTTTTTTRTPIPTTTHSPPSTATTTSTTGSPLLTSTTHAPVSTASAATQTPPSTATITSTTADAPPSTAGILPSSNTPTPSSTQTSTATSSPTVEPTSNVPHPPTDASTTNAPQLTTTFAQAPLSSCPFPTLVNVSGQWSNSDNANNINTTTAAYNSVASGSVAMYMTADVFFSSPHGFITATIDLFSSSTNTTSPSFFLWNATGVISVTSTGSLSSLTFLDSGATLVIVPPTSTSSIDTTVANLISITFDSNSVISVDGAGTPLQCTRSSKTFTLFISILPQSRAGFSQATIQAVTGVAVAGAVVASSMGTATTALQQMRVSGLLGLGDCIYSDVAPLSFSQNPLQLAVGREVGQYWRGAVVGAIVLLSAGILCSALAVTALVAFRRSRNSVASSSAHYGALHNEDTVVWRIKTAAGDVHFPGIMMIPLVLGVQPVMSAALELMQLDGADGGDYVTGLIGLLGCLACIAAVFVATKPWFACRLVQRTEASTLHKVMGHSRASAFLVWALESDQKWANVENNSLYKQRFLLLFAEYRLPWYMVFELSLSAATGIVLGIRSSTVDLCKWQTMLLFVLNAVALAISILVHPALCRTNHAFMVMTNLVSCICALCSFGNVVSTATVWGSMSDILSLAATILIDAKMAFDIIVLLVFFAGFAKLGGSSTRHRHAHDDKDDSAVFADLQIPLTVTTINEVADLGLTSSRSSASEDGVQASKAATICAAEAEHMAAGRSASPTPSNAHPVPLMSLDDIDDVDL
ncbi:membrane-associated protein, putative [Bodo saltans]|uniref:Membrane-associated protein, putative n=1 Tax=Bodo saltans TaxID=75058 RepID=A0A0S4IZX0_BODSA|nr:membrane-associated protein, putative [Bodo saltans]|eukprot:CUG05724.1 membrane-associated protein, putative [Bodo saltans]